MNELVQAVLERQHRTIQLGALSIGGVIAFAESRGDPLVAALLYGLTPLLCVGLLALWAVDARRLDVAADWDDEESRRRPDARGRASVARDEAWAARRSLPWLVAIGLLASALSLALGVRELTGIEDRPGYGRAWVVLYCACGVVALGLLAALGARRPERRLAVTTAILLTGIGATVAVGLVYDPGHGGTFGGGSSTGGGSGGSFEGSPAPSPTTSAPPEPGRYVALGDSYASGEGVSPYYPDTDDPSKGGNDCHRSETAYAALLVLGKPWTLEFRACSGARIDNVFKTAQHPDRGVGVQVAPRSLGDDVRLVTISIGGNDLGFADLLMFCARPGNCFTSDRVFKDGLTAKQWIERAMTAVPATLEDVYSRLRAEAPEARILVLGYPYLFPERMASNVSCQVARLAWNADEREAVRGYGAELNHVIETTVGTAAEFVDLATPFSGHEECGPEENWVQRVTAKAIEKKYRRGLFHPNAEGQKNMARIVSCHLFLIPATPPEEREESLDACLASAA